jgi:hypothetical protein
MAALEYNEALRIYFDSDKPYESSALATKLQPSSGGSCRTDGDDGWHFRNVNGWLATVYDDGRVETFDDLLEATPDDPVAAMNERDSRGTG